MVNNKDRIDVLENGLGLVQDEIQQLSAGINEKLRGMEQSFQRSLEESLGRMQDMLAGGREGGSSTQRRSREPGNHHTDVHREETVNPFAAPPPQPPPPPAYQPPPPPYQPHRPPGHHIKLEFPRFSGGDPSEWMSKAKQYFAYHDMAVDQRVGFASYHLTEEANEWWQALSKARNLNPYQTPWETFEMELWTRFGPLDGENFDEALSHIRQKGTLIEFQREFERLQNKVEGWTEKALVGAFMGGLNTNISRTIRIFKPRTLTEIINLARMRDDQIQQEKRWSSNRSNYVSSSPRPPVPTTTTTDQKATPAPRKLSWEELKRKRSLGLCFSCDERFTPGHRCKQPQLFIMEGIDDGDSNPSDTEDNDTPPEITLQALTGWDSPTTIRLQTHIKHQRILALVDSGSTHNFISNRVAQSLRLPETPTTAFSVRVADGSL